MNQQLKTVLLTILTLSVFVIALVELSGISKTALMNKFGGDDHHQHNATVDPSPSIPRTKMEFEETRPSFGTITDGEVVTHAYKFKNTGDNPLIITNAIASCGCTVPSYPKEPIAPGASGEIVVQFNSNGKVGHQQKNVLINSNAEEPSMSIGFDADVKEK
jgi:hypothetical protein